MNAIEHNDPQHFQRPRYENATRHIRIILHSDDGRNNRTRSIESGFSENSPSKYLVLEFQVRMKKPVEMLRSLAEPHFEWAAHLAAASSATIQDCLATPLDKWIARVTSIISGCPAGLGMETNCGRISVAKPESI